MTTGDDVLAAPLSTLGLATRLTNTLLSNGFSTVGDLVAKSELEIWQLHYLGPATLAEIKDLPLPICPVTGQPFEYRRTGDGTAELTAPPAPKLNPRIKPLKYHLTLRRPTAEGR